MSHANSPKPPQAYKITNLGELQAKGENGKPDSPTCAWPEGYAANLCFAWRQAQSVLIDTAQLSL